jgi:hypothetical protein
MTDVFNTSSAVGADTALGECWANYASTLPQGLAEEDLPRAQDAFFGGACGLYELLTLLQEHVDERGDGALDLVRLGRVLGLDGDTALNG